jgi:hypothetical protein
LSKQILWYFHLHVVTAIECEVTAMKHALQLALSNRFERVIFESDLQKWLSTN